MEGLYLGCIYVISQVPFVFLYQPWSLHVILQLSGVVALRVSLSLYEILQLSFPPMTSVASDGLDFVLFLIIDKVRWRPRVVFSVFFCLHIGGEKRGVENG